MVNAGTPALMEVYRGWDDHQISLVRAVTPLTREQLLWRPAPHLRTTGEVIGHIIGGRVGWFHRTLGLGSPEFAAQAAAWRPDDRIEEQPDGLLRWLELTWQLIEQATNGWAVADLSFVYHLPYEGQNYALPRQWIIWRILEHDIHHGGELSLMLGMQGIAIPELGDQGGHLSERAPLDQPG